MLAEENNNGTETAELYFIYDRVFKEDINKLKCNPDSIKSATFSG